MNFTDKALRREFLSICDEMPIGQLRITTPEGDTHHFGDSGPEADVKIHDWAAISAMAAHGQVGLGEAYVQGLWDTSSIETLIKIVISNQGHFRAYEQPGRFGQLKYRLIDTVLRANSRRGARKNIRSHYDVGNEFYQLWLDESMTYSSGIFTGSDQDLASAQKRKMDRILEHLGPRGRLLEIGCGWGGFAEQAAARGHDVTGITLSRNQHSYADARLDGRADIQFRDYRDIEGKYDNIVSIEMIEAVGERYWPNYFAVLKRSLAEGGRALIQAITVKDNFFETYRKSSDYIRQYVFPGGMLLSDEMIEKHAGMAGLKVESNFAFGQDYSRTCSIWAERLSQQKKKIEERGFGEAFFRNWQYYLEICAASFAVGQINVVQVELAHG